MAHPSVRVAFEPLADLTLVVYAARPATVYNMVLNEREYKRLKQQLQDDYDERMQAIDTVWLMSNSQAGNGTGKRVSRAPAVEGGLPDHVWTLEELIGVLP